MDIGQIGDDGWTSIRTAWREERWLPAGLVVATVAYVLWLGLSGAALTYLAEAVAGAVTFRPWTPLSTFVLVTGALLWVVGPAALAVVLVLRRVTNANGNLRVGYRLRHPLLLFGPPAVLLAVGYGALVGTDSVNPVVVGLLSAGGIWLVVRTTAYAYRVFSLSLPVVAWGLLFATASALATATVLLGGVAVGREPLVTDLLSGVAAETGRAWLATLHSASATVGGVEVPVLLAAAIAVPVGGSGAYVAVQILWSVLTRVRRPMVRRPELRTGQRYPRFARPTTTVSSGTVSAGRRSTERSDDRPGSSPRGEDGPGDAGSTATEGGATRDGDEAVTGTADATPDSLADGDESDASGAADDDDGTEVDAVTHTRVYTPPDGEVDPPEDVAEGRAPADGGEAPVADGSTPGEYCPQCGERLAGSPSACPGCGADLESA